MLPCLFSHSAAGVGHSSQSSSASSSRSGNSSSPCPPPPRSAAPHPASSLPRLRSLVAECTLPEKVLVCPTDSTGLISKTHLRHRSCLVSRADVDRTLRWNPTASEFPIRSQCACNTGPDMLMNCPVSIADELSCEHADELSCVHSGTRAFQRVSPAQCRCPALEGGDLVSYVLMCCLRAGMTSPTSQQWSSSHDRGAGRGESRNGARGRRALPYTSVGASTTSPVLPNSSRLLKTSSQPPVGNFFATPWPGGGGAGGWEEPAGRMVMTRLSCPSPPPHL